MSTKVNFNGEEFNGANNSRPERKTVSPGVDVFTIEEAEVKQNTNGKEFISFKFVNPKGQYLKEAFYTTTTNALKRVKEVATHAGIDLGESDMEEVAAKLTGAKVGLIVGGEKENATIDGREVAVTRARIMGAYNFSFRPSELEFKRDAKIVIEDKTSIAPVQLPTDTAESNDLPF